MTLSEEETKDTKKEDQKEKGETYKEATNKVSGM